jgi:hypothetical protein
MIEYYVNVMKIRLINPHEVIKAIKLMKKSVISTVILLSTVTANVSYPINQVSAKLINVSQDQELNFNNRKPIQIAQGNIRINWNSEQFIMKEQRFDRDRGAFIWIVENQPRCNPNSICLIFHPNYINAEFIDRDGIIFKSTMPNVEGEGKRLRVTLNVNSSDLSKTTEIKVTMW